MKFLVAFALLFALPPAFGLARYTYSGDAFSGFPAPIKNPADALSPFDPYTGSNRIAGYFELSEPIGANTDLCITADSTSSFCDGLGGPAAVDVLDLIFGDGRQQLTLGDPTLDFAMVLSTDASGDLMFWTIELRNRPQGDLTDQSELRLDITDFGDQAQSTTCLNADCSDFVDEAAFNQTAGEWTREIDSEPPEPAEVAVPVPGLAQLTLLTALGAAGVWRRRT